MTRYRDVREVISSIYGSDSRVFDAVLFDFERGTELDISDFTDRPAFAAADDPKVRRKGQPDEPVGLALDHPRVDGLVIVGGDPVDHEAGVSVPPRKSKKSLAMLARTLGDPRQEDHFINGLHGTRVENPDDLEVVPRGQKILGSDQKLSRNPRNGDIRTPVMIFIRSRLEKLDRKGGIIPPARVPLPRSSTRRADLNGTP